MSILAYNANIELVQSHVATYYIYILRNPINQEIFYVGRTMKDLKTRLGQHISDIGVGFSVKANKKVEYVRELVKSGNNPIIEVVDTIHGTCYLDKIKATEMELYWIRHYKEQGCPLTNFIGGEKDTVCSEYNEYLRAIERNETNWHYYYVGITKYGIKVYDEERIIEDGFDFPETDFNDMMPNTDPALGFREKLTYHSVFDDENPNYIRSSQEEV